MKRANLNQPKVAEAAAIAAWKHAAGEQLKEHALHLSLQDRTLKVAVRDAIWQKQLHSMRGQMIYRVNSLLGQPIVDTIEFIVDPNLYADKRS